MNWAGFNCSLPHKVAVIQHLDGLGESAEIMGAVNCVVRRGAAYIGENTDGKGFLASLQRDRRPGRPIGRDVRRRRRGPRRSASSWRSPARRRSPSSTATRRAGRRLVDLLNADARRRAPSWSYGRGDYRVPDGTDIVVNATSIGLFPDVDARSISISIR